MEELWHSLLKLVEPIVIPDWGALIGLLPVFLGLAVVLWLMSTMRRFATAGPARRGRGRIAPVAPAHLHMPGPSWAPFLAAAGLFILLYGVVIGGILFWVGLLALCLSLLFWLGEALRDYDHMDGGTALVRLPAGGHGSPPEGVHMPGPSVRPVLAAMATALLLAGLVFGGLVLVVGVIAVVVSLAGWLRDARAEYVKTVQADVTGHLENIPAPASPARLIGIFAGLTVLAVLVNAGIFPPQTAPAGASSSAAPSSAPAAGDFAITAKEIAFDKKALDATAGKAFTIAFTNADPAAVLHDVDVRDASGKVLSNQNTVSGGQEAVYEYDALAAGTYTFICSVHPIPAMTGTLTVK